VILNVALPSAPSASSVRAVLTSASSVRAVLTSASSVSAVLTSAPSTSFAPSNSPATSDISKDQDQNLPRPPAVEPAENAGRTVSELGISEKDENGHHPLPKTSPLLSGSVIGSEDTRFLIPSIYPHTKTWFSARTPRLFILLPSAADVAVRFCSPSNPHQSQDTRHPVSINQLRLYFLCESADGRITPKHDHWVHLAQHIGSRIARPTVFLEEFGTYILAVMGAMRTGFIQSSKLGSFCSPAAKLAQELNKLEKEEISTRTNVDMYTEDSVVTMLDETIAYLEDLARKSPKVWRETGQLDKRSWREREGVWDHIDLSMRHYILKTSNKPNLYGNLYKIISNDGYCQMVCQTHSHRQSDYDTLRWMIGATVQGKNHFSNHLSFLCLDFSSTAQAPTLFKGLALVKTVSELSLSLNWNVSVADLEGFTAAILQSSVVSLHLYATIPRGETVDALPAGMFARMDKHCAQRHEPLLRMLSEGKLQRFLFRGLPDLFWSLDEE